MCANVVSWAIVKTSYTAFTFNKHRKRASTGSLASTKGYGGQLKSPPSFSSNWLFFTIQQSQESVSERSANKCFYTFCAFSQQKTTALGVFIYKGIEKPCSSILNPSDEAASLFQSLALVKNNTSSLLHHDMFLLDLCSKQQTHSPLKIGGDLGRLL